MTETFKLLGLNKPWKAGGFNGVYATVECGKEDWFHCAFDELIFPLEKQHQLFDYMKDPDQTFKGSTVVVEFEKYSTGNVPVNPIIKEINIPK